MSNNLLELINKKKKIENFVILAHHYQRSEIVEIADYIGDSYYLSCIVSKLKAQKIYFCGVRFMAETAKILSPDKTVILVNPEAGCPMADMVTKENLIQYKSNNPEHIIVSYVNTSAEVKAYTDICVTSSVATIIMESLKDKEILFLPDKNLGRYVKEKTNNSKINLWDGYCPVHNDAKLSDLNELKNKYPNAISLVHPECVWDLLESADFVGSTTEIIDYVNESNCNEFIIGTEEGVLHSLQRQYPKKIFYSLYKDFICEDMKKTTLSDLENAICGNGGEAIVLSDEVIKKASKSLNEMIARSSK